MKLMLTIWVFVSHVFMHSYLTLICSCLSPISVWLINKKYVAISHKQLFLWTGFKFLYSCGKLYFPKMTSTRSLILLDLHNELPIPQTKVLSRPFLLILGWLSTTSTIWTWHKWSKWLPMQGQKQSNYFCLDLLSIWIFFWPSSDVWIFFSLLNTNSHKKNSITLEPSGCRG